MDQVFARITGYGLSVAPVWPYRVERVPDDPAALAVMTRADELRRSVVLRGGRDTPVADLGDRVVDLAEVVDVLRGSDEPEWRVETARYSVVWPAGFAVESPVDTPSSIDDTLFDLHGPDGVLIWVRGPYPRSLLPNVDALAAPGQTLTGVYSDGGMEAAELAYEHDGGSWSQRHYLVPFEGELVLVVSAQAPLRHGDLYRRASADVVTSVRPTIV